MRYLPELWGSPRNFRSPFKELQSMQRQMSRFFEDFAPLENLSEYSMGHPPFTPSCDVEETDSHFLMSFDLPGIKKEDIHIELQDDQLRVSGERKEEHEQKEKSRTRSERFFGSFERTFSLPRSIKAEQVEATYSDGVLRLSVPKAESAKTQQIKIGEGKPSGWKPKPVTISSQRTA